MAEKYFDHFPDVGDYYASRDGFLAGFDAGVKIGKLRGCGLAMLSYGDILFGEMKENNPRSAGEALVQKTTDFYLNKLEVELRKWEE